MDSTYIFMFTNLISSQYVFAFIERPCAVLGVSHSGVYVVAGGSGKFLDREVLVELDGPVPEVSGSSRRLPVGRVYTNNANHPISMSALTIYIPLREV